MSDNTQEGDNHTKVRAYLRRDGFSIGDRLPGEREIAAELGIGRAALRTVLDDLEAEGVLRRQPQSGTFLTAIPAPPARSARIAVIAPFGGTGEPDRETDPAWLHRVVSAFERTAAPAGARITLYDQSPLLDDHCSVLTLAREAAAGGARAVVLVHAVGTRGKIGHALAVLHDLGVHPVIVSSRTYAGLASDVYFDSGWGAYLATRHLLAQGHRRIGFAGAPSGHEWVQERLRAYRSALEAADVEPQSAWISLPEEGERLPSPQDGAAFVRQWRAMPADTRPTGVVAANDRVALGVLDAAKEGEARVPEDLSVVGFDNDPEALRAGLTTVDRPTEALGEAVARVTLERLAAGSGAAVTVRLRPVLIERGTVGPPPVK